MPHKMMQLLSILIGRLLFMLIAICELLQQLWLRLHALARRSYDYWQCDYHHELFERTMHELQKLPQHLVLVIAPDDRYVDATLLKRIFSYAQIVGIPYLSVYDTRTPKNGYVDLSRFCQSSGNENKCYLWPSQQVKEQKQVQLNGCKTVVSNGTTNGSASNGTKHYAQLQVYQIGTADGHALIADVCRELYENRKTPQVQELLKERQALTEGISARLNKHLGFAVPEPELGIIFSRLTCIYGLLPWHVRFTEFHTHRSGSYFDAKSFAKVLYKYARCEQRWGK
ncbi:dehydrodolichyl diphosphate synthase complex subunit nus1 [Drosophila innubila]|uniref:dehydrodolichyl diphosphate synthase complex subunit nus1 n=1 Tax=Drosophila innubila TaxID=198719 RepID=UPI00148CAC62|nr:dehydrodolichyl diphosphate synthase complex subunit nus1 [Drosophila innubila]